MFTTPPYDRRSQRFALFVVGVFIAMAAFHVCCSPDGFI